MTTRFTPLWVHVGATYSIVLQYSYNSRQHPENSNIIITTSATTRPRFKTSLRKMSSPSTTSSEFSHILTPESGSDESDIAWSYVEHGGNDADFVLPSTETDDNGRIPFSIPRFRTPSISIAPSGTGVNPILTPSSSTPRSARTSRETTVEQLGGRLQHVDLSSTCSRAATPSTSIGLSRVTSQSPPVRREESLHPESVHGTPRRQSAGRRRRSASQINHPTHNVSDEEPPSGSFHHAAFQAALTNSKAQLQDLQHVLGSSSLHTDSDSAIYGLYNRAVQLGGFHCPTTRKVALVGDSGVGTGLSALKIA